MCVYTAYVLECKHAGMSNQGAASDYMYAIRDCKADFKPTD
jgi:hypothetical protein